MSLSRVSLKLTEFSSEVFVCWRPASTPVSTPALTPAPPGVHSKCYVMFCGYLCSLFGIDLVEICVLKWSILREEKQRLTQKPTQKWTQIQGHQSQMQNSIKLFRNEKLTFIKKQKYPYVGNLLTFVNL